MKNKIIDAQIFKAQISEKTTWVFILLKNNDGIEGWGEATLSGREEEIYKIKDLIFTLILNLEYKIPYDLKDKLPFENIVQASISSAIMQCLWDIEAQKNNKTIGALFEQKREKIDIYANFNRSTKDRSLEGIKTKSIEVKNDRFDFIKFAPFDEVKTTMNTSEMIQSMKFGLDRINVIREIFGPNTKIMIDCHWRFNFDATMELLEECKPFNLYWLECPIPETHENIPTIKEIRNKANSLDIKLAGLETKILKDGFLEFIKGDAYDVMMPDVKYAGGPDEMLEIEKTLIRHNVDFSPHNPSGPISHAHTLQICSASQNPPLMEHQYMESFYFDALLKSPNPKINLGKSSVPNTRDGLGVSINLEEIQKLKV